MPNIGALSTTAAAATGAIQSGAPAALAQRRTSKATGNAITRTKDGLITWDDASRTMSLVETKAGGITATAQFPSAKWVASTASMDGTIMLLCDDGRVQQLKPIEMMKPTAAPQSAQTIPAAVKEAGADGTTDASATEPAKDDAPGAGESTP